MGKLLGDDFYDGEFRDGKRHGNGTSFWNPTEVRFMGEWRDGMPYKGTEYKFWNGEPLGQVVNGDKPGREGDEIIVCDLTGTGAQDAATSARTARCAVLAHCARGRIAGRRRVIARAANSAWTSAGRMPRVGGLPTRRSRGLAEHRISLSELHLPSVRRQF